MKDPAEGEEFSTPQESTVRDGRRIDQSEAGAVLWDLDGTLVDSPET